MESSAMSIGTLNLEVDFITSANSESTLRHMPHQNYIAFGLPSDFSELILPSIRDVLKYYFFLSDCYKGNNKMFSYGRFTSQVSDRLIDIWKKLNIAIINKRSVVKKLNTLLKRYSKETKNKPTSENYKAFLHTINNVFNIGKCQCNLEINLCSCGLIPEHLKEFMLDQHTGRKHTIPEPIAEISELLSTQPPASHELTSYRPCSSEFDIENEMELQAPTTTEEIPLKRGPYTERYTTRNFAMACDRFGISDRVASFLATALFRDIGFKDKRGEFIVMDKAKVAREKKKCRDFVRTQHNDSDITAFSFDGRKDISLAREYIGGKYHTNLVKEPHIVIVQEPQNKLMGYLKVNAENAETKQRQIYDFFVERNLPLSNLIGICCDGEVTNTGSENGILRKFEIMLDKPLHWFVCLLHFNELPFRHLFSALEKSTTSGPRTFSGCLSKLMETCEQQQAVPDDDSILFEPPFTANIPYDHLLEYIEIEDPPVPDPRIPAHIQGTERFVQLLTNVSRRAIENNRDDIMAVTIESRSKIPRMDSKKDLIPSAIDRIN